MRLHHLRPAPGAKRPRRRVGRGRAAGQGKTAGRGTKGYLAKHGKKPGYEGGQMPRSRGGGAPAMLLDLLGSR